MSSSHAFDAVGRPESGAPVAERRTPVGDPLERYWRRPVGSLLARGLTRTPIQSNQVSVLGLVSAVAAGYLLVTHDSTKSLLAAAALLEARAILAATGEALARERKTRDVGSATGLLAAMFLYLGIFWHFRLHPPPAGAWSEYLSTTGVLALALLQFAARGFFADDYARRLARAEATPGTRLLGALWSVSGAGFFQSIIVVTLVVNQLWLGQLLFASAGVAWIGVAVVLTRWHLGRALESSPQPAPVRAPRPSRPSEGEAQLVDAFTEPRSARERGRGEGMAPSHRMARRNLSSTSP